MIDLSELIPDSKYTIKLRSGRQIIGNFKSASRDGEFIVIDNITDALSGKKNKTQQKYYKNEIESIRSEEPVTQNNKNGLANNVSQSNDGPTSDESSVSNNGGNKFTVKKKTFSESELNDIEQLVSNAIYISRCDDIYHMALEDLKKQEYIVINSENRYGRLHFKKPLLTMFTPNKVYLFDILKIGSIHKELKVILQAKEPRKVIFNSALINDYLVQTEKVNSNSVSDVMVSKLI